MMNFSRTEITGFWGPSPTNPTEIFKLQGKSLSQKIIPKEKIAEKSIKKGQL